MSSFKCYYVQARGRAEVCRLSFAAANIEFEDIRMEREEWAKEKESKQRQAHKIEDCERLARD